MAKKGDVTKGSENRRSEPRSLADKYSSVEFSVSNLAFNFQFKIWETSQSGMSILAKEDSAVLEEVKVGDILDMKYYPEELTDAPLTLKTEIKHITKHDEGKFKGHYLLGLASIEE